jgi:dihydroflavonol-4-reductase
LILITGATGFLGHNLCEHLAAQGYTLRALARPTSETAFLEELGVDIVLGDVTDAASVGAAMRGCAYVVHAAARFRLWGPPEPFVRTNVEGTRNVLQAALAANIKKFIHISTIIVVGPQKPGVVITEEIPCSPYPGDNYAQTKCCGEGLALDHFEKGLPVVIFCTTGGFRSIEGDISFSPVMWGMRPEPLNWLWSGVELAKYTTSPIKA